MKVATYKCEVCGKLKPPASQSGWFIATSFPKSTYDIRFWTDSGAEADKTQHFCSPSCLIKRVEEFCGGK